MKKPTRVREHLRNFEETFGVGVAPFDKENSLLVTKQENTFIEKEEILKEIRKEKIERIFLYMDSFFFYSSNFGV